MLPHLAARIFGTPLLVQRAKLDVILAVLGERLNILPPATELAAPLARTPASGVPGIAVIAVHGTLVKRTAGLDAASGLTSYADLGVTLESALADPQVAGILLDIDSPGGEASGSFELARRVREGAAVKPIWALANDSAFSAAYAIAAAADRVIISETGGVGSIGVIALHIDQSIKDAHDGYRYTAVTAGSHKNDFSPHEPLSDTAKAELQAEVDRLYGLFVDHVAGMRRCTAEQVRLTEAGLFFGANAVAAGLADALGTFESVLSDFSLYLCSRGRPAPLARAVSRSGAAHSLKEEAMQQNENPLAEMIGVDAAALLVDEARRAVTLSAQAVAELCLIAGVPEKAAGFIAAGKTEAQVRRTLIEARAAHSDALSIQSTITPAAGTQEMATPENSPIVRAIKKLIAKE